MEQKDESIERRLAADLRTLAYSLRSLLRRPAVTCRAGEPLRAVVGRMREAAIGSIVVMDAGQQPIGIFTERDLLRTALDTALDAPIETVMTRDPLALPANTPAYEAALAMIERGVRHVLVTDGGALAGVLSERDLFALQRLGLGELSIEIRSANTIEALAAAAARVRRLTKLLVAQGVAAEPLTLYVSLLNDRIGRRLVALHRERFDLGGIGWCWLAFGSEGRLEQTFATDQDNGIVFDVHAGIKPAEARARLLPFARAVNEALDQCGFPLCKGNVMASNPDLCLTADEWRARIEGWFNVSEPQALLDAAICLDFRPLAGDGRLADALRAWMLPLTASRRNFLRLLAETTVRARPSSKWRSFLRADGGEAGGMIDLKRDGARIIVDCARVLALANALTPTNTADRLRAAAAAGVYPAAEADAAVAAFFFIQSLRLRHQATSEQADAEGLNRIDRATLNELDRGTLKASLGFARALQERVALDFQL